MTNQCQCKFPCDMDDDLCCHHRTCDIVEAKESKMVYRKHIYVASKFENKENVRRIYESLKKQGHIVTHDWTKEAPGNRKGAQLKTYMKRCAERDLEGVRNADAILLLNHPNGFGTMVELGLALAWGKKIYLVDPGARDCVFYNLAHIKKFETVEGALAAIDNDFDIELEG